MNQQQPPRKCCLLVLDGWGHNPASAPEIQDAIVQAVPQAMLRLSRACPSTLLLAHGTHVGLCDDTAMGNSEVGHLTIGAGRVVLQDSVRIRQAFESGSTAPLAQKALAGNCQRVHLLGILSDGNIHGHWRDLLDLAKLAAPLAAEVCLHTVSDGRDTRPTAYLHYLDEIMPRLPPNASVVSVAGRFYTMDRDNREERTALAFSVLTDSKAAAPRPTAGTDGTTAQLRAYLTAQYESGATDEFVQPFCLAGGTIAPGEKVIISNFRVDRVKQIYTKLAAHAELYTMTRVFPNQPAEEVLFERPAVTHTLGDIVEANGLSQARIAETEKQAHVTFFLDGGLYRQRARSAQEILPSPSVATYDHAPAMAAAGVAQAVLAAIDRGTDLICANFANCDMVGHTGNLAATVQAVQAVDREIAAIHRRASDCGYALIVTADHGNAEIMADAHGPVKTHTVNRVPLIIALPENAPPASEPAGESAGELASEAAWGFTELPNASLADVAPTILALLHLPQPEEMTGAPLLPQLTRGK